MTELEKDKHNRLLHGEMESYTDCFVVNKAKILALFDEDITKLTLKLEKAKEYHQTTVSKLDQLQARVKDVVDEFMKTQLQEMSGSFNNNWTFEELRKFPLTNNIEKINFESVTFEKLESLPRDKPIKLQRFNCYYTALSKIELFFTNELESAAYQNTTHTPSRKEYELTWDASKEIKKISIKFEGKVVRGLKFLDEKDSEIVKWDSETGGTWSDAKSIPEGFEIIGIYGDTT